MATPVFSFDAELLTDAPFEHIQGRLQSMDSPEAFRCLKPLRFWQPVECSPDGIHLRWERRVAGALELGCLRIRPDERGAHLRLEGSLRGWTGFLLFGLLRFRTDRLLDRFVEEL